MTNVSKNMLFAIAVLVGATALSLGAFATTVHADDWGDGGSFDAGGWTDGGSYGGWTDAGSYDSGWTDAGSYNPGFTDAGSYDSGWTDAGSYNPGYYTTDSYNPGYYTTDSYNPGTYTTDSYNPGTYETYSYNPGTYETDSYNPGTTYEQGGYVQQALQSYAQSSGYSMGGTSGGFSMPSFGSIGCTSCHTSVPSYPTPVPTPVCTSCNHPVPVPTPVPTPVPGNTNITTNSCTGNSCNNTTNTYVDNSINGSFNTNIKDSGNTTVLQPVVPQQTIQYVGVPQVQAPAPYCVITLQNAGQYNVQANLVWSSSNAQTAYITQMGTVAPNGSRFVTGYANQVYSMTVTGQGGTYTCQTQPFTPTYVAPTITPSVSLDQIPYTGLTMTPAEEAMYWLAILSIAAAGAYLAVYYKGGVMALATTAMNRRTNHFVVSENETEAIQTPVTEEAQEEVQEEVSAPAVNVFDFLPAIAESKTRDSMSMVRNADGMPRIVIARA